MTFRVKYDVFGANGMVNHSAGPIELPKWSSKDALAQLKRRLPNAKKIKILDHDPK